MIGVDREQSRTFGLVSSGRFPYLASDRYGH